MRFIGNLAMLSRMIRVAALTAALAGPAGVALAQNEAASDPGAADPVVARVNGEAIKRSDVLATLEQLPPQVRQLPFQVIYPAVIDQLINGKLVAQAGYAENLDEDPEVQARLERAEERIVQETYLYRRIDASITEEMLRERYQQALAETPPQPEVKASHILVETREEAEQIIRDLRGGADFATLAKEKSIDPSAETNQGDLGYFTADQMVKPFADAAFALEPGQMTEGPVETSFGWHVIKVEDRRERQPPSFEEMEIELREQASQQILAQILDELREGAEIERFQPDGSPLPEAPAAPAE